MKPSINEDAQVNPRTGNVTLVRDYKELPPWPTTSTRNRREYARLKSDPMLLQDYHNGDLFARRDGKAWEQAGYFVTRLASGEPHHEPATAWANSDEVPKGKAAA